MKDEKMGAMSDHSLLKKRTHEHSGLSESLQGLVGGSTDPRIGSAFSQGEPDRLNADSQVLKRIKILETP